MFINVVVESIAISVCFFDKFINIIVINIVNLYHDISSLMSNIVMILVTVMVSYGYGCGYGCDYGFDKCY